MKDPVEEELKRKRVVTTNRLCEFGGIPDRDSIRWLEFRRLFRELVKTNEMIDDTEAFK